MTYIDSALFGIFAGCSLTVGGGIIAESILGVNVNAVGFGMTVFIMSFLMALLMEAESS